MTQRVCLCRLVVVIVVVTGSASAAHADIYQWEYINPADPSQGKQQSATLAPDGAGVDAVPGADLDERNLTMAHLVGADLTGASVWGTNLTSANLSQSNLTDAILFSATLFDADFTGAKVQGTNFNSYFRGSGITLAQLYSTTSYQAHSLTGINLDGHNMIGGNFAGQDLTNASFGSATLTDANFRDAVLTNANFGGASGGMCIIGFCSLPPSATLTGADFSGAQVQGAHFGGSGITLGQLYSTVSYRDHDLSGIGLGANDFTGGNFARQNLTNASFSGAFLTGADFRNAILTNAQFYDATLLGADFTGANVRGARFSRIQTCSFRSCSYSGGITLKQLYSTASYQAKDLSGISLYAHDLSSGNFAAQDLTDAYFYYSTLTGADFADAVVRGANFRATGLTPAQLYSTASYQARDLRGIALSGNLAGWNLAGQNLINADFDKATLTGADFSDADVREANFEKGIPALDFPFGTGLSLDQLYSTFSYQGHDLTGIRLVGNDLSDADFTNQNLTNADFRAAKLDRADFTGADIRRARFGTLRIVVPGISLEQFYSTANYQRRDLRGVLFGVLFGDLSNADTTNVILPGGHINGIDLSDGELLVVSDYEGKAYAELDVVPITVDQHLTMAPGGTLRMVFEADAWDSTISFAPGIPVTLGGTLELTFADDVNLATQLGRTLKIFDWTGVTPTGAFAVSSPYAWDLSNLYTTGQVTLTAIPEPATPMMFIVALLAMLTHQRRKYFAINPPPPAVP